MCTFRGQLLYLKYISEEKIEKQFDDAIKAVSLAKEHIEYIKQGLKESLADKKEFSEQMRTNLQAEEKRLRNRIDKITDDYYDEKIPFELYNRKLIIWQEDLEKVMAKLEALHNTEKKYYEEGVRIIETLKNAYSLYLQQTPSEKREMLNYLLSNCTLKGEKVSYDYNLPFSYFVNFANCRKKYAWRDCLGRSRLTAIPHFVFRSKASSKQNCSSLSSLPLERRKRSNLFTNVN